MIDLEAARLPTHIDYDKAFSQHYQYLQEYPTPEKRLSHARQLVQDDGALGTPNKYLTRSLFAAHWAENSADSFRLARAMYDLYYTMVRFRGETVIRLTRFEPDDIEPDSGQLPLTAKVEVSTLARPFHDIQLNYDFHKPAAESLPDTFQSFRFLGFEVGIATSSSQLLTTGSNRALTAWPRTEEQACIPALVGRVCLEDDSALYHASSVSQMPRLIFGNLRAYDFISSIAQTIGGDAQKEFKERVTSGQIRNNKPLPDLEFLAAA